MEHFVDGAVLDGLLILFAASKTYSQVQKGVDIDCRTGLCFKVVFQFPVAPIEHVNLNRLLHSQTTSILSSWPINFRGSRNHLSAPALQQGQEARSRISSFPDLRFRAESGGSVPGFPPPSLFPLRRHRSHSLCFDRMMSQSDPAETADATPEDTIKSVRCVIKGRVQGVFYRDWTVENATQLGLNGWVRNRRDGSIEALFSGKPEAVDEMQRRCRHGPPAAVVTGYEAFPWSDEPGTGFERKPTI
ncbi:hypothetical protein Dimus_007133 [Dionaea muscipula]